MIYSPHATKITREHQAGKPMAKCEPDMTNRRSKVFLRGTYNMAKRALEDAAAGANNNESELEIAA